MSVSLQGINGRGKAVDSPQERQGFSFSGKLGALQEIIGRGKKVGGMMSGKSSSSSHISRTFQIQVFCRVFMFGGRFFSGASLDFF